MSVFSGDFLGFQLGNIHSSQLNITRVSNSDRYLEKLSSNFNDITTQIPGGDGTYYWNTFYSQTPFTIDFAFDDLRGEDIRRLKQIFNFKGVQELIFDEMPYKKYYVKCSQPPSITYIAFNYEGITIYKGEGSVNLVAYYPYALSTYSYQFNNKTSQQLENIGDLETPAYIYYEINNSNSNINLNILVDNEIIGTLNLSNISKLNNNDIYFCINNRTHLINGLDSSFNKTGTLYNKFITTGDFFLLPLGKSIITSNVAWISLKFNYLYY